MTKLTFISQPQEEEVQNIERVTSYQEVSSRTGRWETAMKVHDKNSDQEVADIVMANCSRKLVSIEVQEHLQKRAHTVLYSDDKKYLLIRSACA